VIETARKLHESLFVLPDHTNAVQNPERNLSKRRSVSAVLVGIKEHYDAMTKNTPKRIASAIRSAWPRSIAGEDLAITHIAIATMRHTIGGGILLLRADIGYRDEADAIEGVSYHGPLARVRLACLRHVLLPAENRTPVERGQAIPWGMPFNSLKGVLWKWLTLAHASFET
jgi:hypothetical protein